METSNLELLKIAFTKGLELSNETDPTSLEYRQISEWDSIGHMALIAEIEDTFDVQLDTNEVIDLSNFNKALAILSSHGITGLE
jgi:acyl carrier protein